jgi:hypothetical protein
MVAAALPNTDDGLSRARRRGSVQSRPSEPKAIMPVNRFEPSASPTPPEAEPGADDQAADRGGPEAVRRLHAQLEELGQYVRLYLAARGDALLASVRAIGLWLVAGVAALVALVALLATAAAIGMLGVADLVGQSLGRPWAGYVITGFGFLALCALGLLVALVMLRRSFRRKTVKKYARRHEEQRRRFGHDVAGRAAARQAERS